jgi:hypothetical protein
MSPDLWRDLIDADQRRLLVETVRARRIAQAATSAFTRALEEVERLEAERDGLLAGLARARSTDAPAA